MSKKEVDEKMARLEKLRKELDAMAQRKARVLAELDMHRKAMAELEKKCKDEFGCGVEEIETLAAKLESEADEKLAEVERLLGKAS